MLPAKAIRLLFLSLLFSFTGFTNVDSLSTVWNNTELPDSARIDALNRLIWQKYIFSSPDSAVIYCQKLEPMAVNFGDKSRLAIVYNTIGSAYYFLGDLGLALNYYEKMGSLLDYYPGEYGESVYYGNLANIYFYQENYDKALEHYYKVADLFDSEEMELNKATTWNNIGNIYFKQERYPEAFEAYDKSLEIRLRKKDSIGLSATYTDIATAQLTKGSFNQALIYFKKGLTISEAIQCNECLANTYKGFGKYYFELNRPDSSVYYSKKGYDISVSNGFKLQLLECTKQLYLSYKMAGQYENALDIHENYLSIKDSISNSEHKEEIIRADIKYQYQKQATADSIKAADEAMIKDAELAAQQSENKRKTQQTYYLIAGLGLAIIFGIFIFNRFRLTQKQKGIIEEQKDKVDQAYKELGTKNQEILDSITYAKRIQSAILPSDTTVKTHLGDSFILYLPKDIVAGDFYWIEVVGDITLFAVADCTGHGVPGAMVSVVCHNALNRAVKEFGLTDPGAILDKTKEIVVAEFEKSNENVRDGMDIALCSLKGSTLKYAGAHNPLWIIRHNEEELVEIKANKQPIGKFGHTQPFVTHSIELEEEDMIYLFSDGYADQFGGETGKKLKTKNLKKLLRSIRDKTPNKQRIALAEFFHTWKGNLEQLDDVCMIGAKPLIKKNLDA